MIRDHVLQRLRLFVLDAQSVRGTALLAVIGSSVSRLAGGEVPGNGGPGELLAQQAGKEQQRAAWPVTRHDVLRLPGVVAGDEDDTADGLAADLSDVVLEEAVVGVGAGVLVLLAVIQRADGDHD